MNSEQLQAFESVLKSKSANMALNLAKELGNTANDKKAKLFLEAIVIKAGDPELIYDFARDVKGADIKALQKAIIKAGKPYWIYSFAVDVKGADIKALQSAADDTEWLISKLSKTRKAPKKAVSTQELDDVISKYPGLSPGGATNKKR